MPRGQHGKGYETEKATATPLEQLARQTKAGARKRKNRKASRKRRGKKLEYQTAARSETKRVRVNRKADRFDVDEGRGWIVVRAESGRTSRAAEVLRSAGCPVFEARHEVRGIVRGRQTVRKAPMMRRLLFVGVEAPEQACMLIDLDYVEAVYCRGEGLWLWADAVAIQGARPAVIPPRMMAKFADHITGHLKGDRQVGDFVEMLFSVGEVTRVSGGPFAGFFATVESSNPTDGTYKTSVGIFGRATSVELEEHQLEKA